MFYSNYGSISCHFWDYSMSKNIATLKSRSRVNQGNWILGLIHRIIQYKNPTVLVSMYYKSMVRPHLGNCSVVWSPHDAKDKALHERVQHRFTRMFIELKSLPYEKRLNKLGLWSLEERRKRADLIEIYKMIKGLSSMQWSHFFVRVVNSNTRGHA